MTHPLSPLGRELAVRSVHYVLIGVSGANLYGPAGQAVFMTDDFNLFLPRDADNLVKAWASCEDAGLELWSGSEPLDRPRDRWLAKRIVERRALTRVTGPNDLVESKQATGRDKDKLFLATHLEALKQLLQRPDQS